MLPVLAAVTGAQEPRAAGAGAHRARGSALRSCCWWRRGLLIYSARVNSFVPQVAWYWALGAVAAALARRRGRPGRARVDVQPRCWRSALGAILAWQALLCEYALIPPARSARELVSAVRPFIGAHTPLYSVGQYRETVSPYLGRTLQLAGYEGELQFGLREEPQRRMTLEQFAARWSAADQGVAFFDPQLWDSWRRRGFPGRVIAADNYTVAVSRL